MKTRAGAHQTTAVVAWTSRGGNHRTSFAMLTCSPPAALSPCQAVALNAGTTTFSGISFGT